MRLNIPLLQPAFRKPDVNHSYMDYNNHMGTKNSLFVHTGVKGAVMTSMTKKRVVGVQKVRTRGTLEMETSKGSRSEALR